MITSWRLFNFKSFRDDTTVKLGPLTVLAGANSSGKSTLLQSMLMVAQTLESRVASRPVVLNGPFVRLGTFDDVRSHGSESVSVLVGFELAANETAVAGELVFDGGADPADQGRLHPLLLSSDMARWSRDSVIFDSLVSARVRRAPVAPGERARALGLDVADDTLPPLTYELRVTGKNALVRTDHKYTGCTLEHFLVKDVYDIEPENPQRLVRVGPFNEIRDAADLLCGHFAHLRYLGPLRDDPRALYPLSTTADTTDVGLRGEHTAAVYDLHRQSLVRYVPTGNFPTPAPNAGGVVTDTRTRTLESAVTEWLQYLGVVESITTRDLGNLGHELKVSTAGDPTPHNLTHVGAGVSQVLPIVVMCLLAAPDTTLLIEQPELHLHPRVQTLLGDFFLAAAMAGKQVIVETHSEYLVNRLRYRIAASEGDRVAQFVKTYFVEKDAKGASVFRAVNVNNYGAITEWPKGFFDQSQREIEQILLAGSMKKKAERGGGRDGKPGA
ncbi:MAG: DUF3696 domain-containing protein [Polyangiales bacterium]